jgi:hypothetical protein
MGESCVSSQCVCGTTACSNGQACCPSATGVGCTDTQTDPKNCGFCGNRCGTGEACMGGMCTCAGGPHCVGNQTCCSTGCFDLASDPGNCGACGHPCNPGEACMMGMCVTTGCSPACTNGNLCTGTICTCNGGSACTGASTCCPNIAGCVNLQTDPMNCGNCGKPCNLGDLCCNGICTPQGSSNCGGCGIKCGTTKPAGGAGIPEPEASPGMDGGTLGGICCPSCTLGAPYFCSSIGCPVCPSGPS